MVPSVWGTWFREYGVHSSRGTGVQGTVYIVSDYPFLSCVYYTVFTDMVVSKLLRCPQIYERAPLFVGSAVCRQL